MKTNVLVSLFIMVALCFSCEDKNDFKTVSHEVYKITNVEKKGCFNYNMNDSFSIPFVMNPLSFEFIGDKCLFRCGVRYYCNSTDSLALNGNVLQMFLTNNQIDTSCRCVYNWNVSFDVIENKGMKIVIYGLNGGDRSVLMEAYSNGF